MVEDIEKTESKKAAKKEAKKAEKAAKKAEHKAANVKENTSTLDEGKQPCNLSYLKYNKCYSVLFIYCS